MAGRWGRIIQLDRKQQLIILLLAGVILFSGGYRYAQIKERAANESKPALENTTETKTKEIQVHVVGAVDRPGVYKLFQGARVIDAVNMAGPKEDADLDSLQLASLLNDGKTIPVPFKTSSPDTPGNISENTPGGGGYGAAVPGQGAGQAGSAQANGLVNINTADLSQLDTLPGIGPSLAQRIVQYRETNGSFYSIEDIKNVSGIGDKKFEELKDKITVR
ncbi:ComEA family DNA-binding protein [Pelotomaculum terephthalicicum JT]|uniref:ComEA family DNA-binding protein n=1 Tax=Pelotomaculum terephthalicicum TaxID=206393 RepID=UPI001F0412D5|nr:ComEA family DNA-binding protein [Pelotomaculum terephthalicicum]MCG9967019.1 ComEA family DNA-binding protein [Pelotomaculum terephthalicicum JT]